MKYAFVFLLTISMLVVGCSATPETAEPEPPVEEPQETEETVQETAPLTGLDVEDRLEHPVVMVMVNNHPQARPQSGLNRADIVFEILAEGEITRFAAFYHSETEGTIGPVRSARPYYMDLAEGMGAVVAHAGGSPAAKERFTQPGYPSLDGIAGGSQYFTREEFRQAPHNLYTSMEQLLQGVADNQFTGSEDIPQLTFADSSEHMTDGAAAERVDIIYSSLYEIGYAYDASTGQYTRSTQGETHTDFHTDRPLSTDNVLVIEAAHQVLDDQGRREIDITGTGQGWLFQKGKAQEIEWRYENGFPRPYADGEELPLIPGKTWVNVVPETATVQFVD
mgnify:CR=1 FL=1